MLKYQKCDGTPEDELNAVEERFGQISLVLEKAHGRSHLGVNAVESQTKAKTLEAVNVSPQMAK